MDDENGNNLCQDAMDKETKNNRIVFDVREEGESHTVGYKEMAAHTIFVANLDAGFMRTSRFVVDGHKVDTTNLMVYTPVVSRDIV